MPLSPAEIGERLRAQFGRDLLSADEQFGHAVLTVTPDRYVEMARFLRDEPDLGFDFFDFLTAVDYQPKDRGYELVVQVHQFLPAFVAGLSLHALCSRRRGVLVPKRYA